MLLVIAFLAVMPPASSAGEKHGDFRIAVLPFFGVAVPDATCERLRERLVDILQKKFDVVIISKDEARAAVLEICGDPSAWWECLNQDEKLLAVGNQMGVKTVVAGRLAAVGERLALKIRVADVPAGRVSAEVVKTAVGDEDAILNKFLLLHERRFPRRETEPWYRKWEYWAVVGAGVALVAGAVALGIAYRSPDGNSDGNWDVHVSLPPYD